MKTQAKSRAEFEAGAKWMLMRASYFKGVNAAHYADLINECQRTASWYLDRALDCPDAFEKQN